MLDDLSNKWTLPLLYLTMVSQVSHKKPMVSQKEKNGKLQLIHTWFSRNLSCLSVVQNLKFYPPEVSLVRFINPLLLKTWLNM